MTVTILDNEEENCLLVYCMTDGAADILKKTQDGH
jgi:hypothetical protein